MLLLKQFRIFMRPILLDGHFDLLLLMIFVLCICILFCFLVGWLLAPPAVLHCCCCLLARRQPVPLLRVSITPQKPAPAPRVALTHDPQLLRRPPLLLLQQLSKAQLPLLLHDLRRQPACRLPR
jgi:hypothetical protein